MEVNHIANYSCINCSKCPDGDLFKIPKEDLQDYKEYLEKVKEYDEIHNSELAKRLSYKINEDNI